MFNKKKLLGPLKVHIYMYLGPPLTVYLAGRMMLYIILPDQLSVGAYTVGPAPSLFISFYDKVTFSFFYMFNMFFKLDTCTCICSDRVNPLQIT